jgi:hypothetical protein
MLLNFLVISQVRIKIYLLEKGFDLAVDKFLDKFPSCGNQVRLGKWIKI